MKYSRENLPPIGLIFKDSGGTYKIIKITNTVFILKDQKSLTKEFDYSIDAGIKRLNEKDWQILKIPELTYEIY